MPVFENVDVIHSGWISLAPIVSLAKHFKKHIYKTKSKAPAVLADEQRPIHSSTHTNLHLLLLPESKGTCRPCVMAVRQAGTTTRRP